MSQLGLLSRVVAALEEAGIAYMVSGSTVSSMQGQPRATHDADVVVDISAGDLRRLKSLLDDPAIYLDEAGAAAAVLQHRLFNLIDTSSGDKVDFWPLTDGAFDRSRFSRRIRVDVLGTPMDVSAPEDTILMKLRWARESGGSAKQYGDALGVYEVQAGTLDEEYLTRWAAELGVSDLLDCVREEARPVET